MEAIIGFPFKRRDSARVCSAGMSRQENEDHFLISRVGIMPSLSFVSGQQSDPFAQWIEFVDHYTWWPTLPEKITHKGPELLFHWAQAVIRSHAFALMSWHTSAFPRSRFISQPYPNANSRSHIKSKAFQSASIIFHWDVSNIQSWHRSSCLINHFNFNWVICCFS